MVLPPPAPAPETPSSARGRALFDSTGCAGCHTPSLATGPQISSGSGTVPSAALSGKRVDLYSDLLVHGMGEGLADGIAQGGAGPDEFRTAPLWGLRFRNKKLHDGRTTSTASAIQAHDGQGAAARNAFNAATAAQRNDLLLFLSAI